ncbi:MAG: retropepsin-like aspartic protease [Cyanobium sp.]
MAAPPLSRRRPERAALPLAALPLAALATLLFFAPQTKAALIQLKGTPLSGGRIRGGALLPLERAAGGDTPVLSFRSGRGGVRLLLDTGASSTMVTPELAQRLGLASQELPGDALDLAGGGQDCGSQRPRRTSLPPLQLEWLRIEGLEALLLPIAALPAGVDGVLGVPSLRRLPVWVDPQANRLGLGPAALAEARAAASPALRLPLRWKLGVPLLRLRGPQGPIEALADTGAEGLFLSPALAGRLPPLGPATPLILVGVCGRQTVQRRPFADIALPGEAAAAAGRPVEGIITTNPIFRQLGVEAIAGQELLRQRRQLWRLDAPAPRLELW